jgi:ribonuclease HI
MAFLLACDIMKMTGDEKVEVVSDSLVVLGWITRLRGGGEILPSLLEPLRSLWGKKRIILSKVAGHSGNIGNELADRWSKHARRETDPRARVNGGKYEQKLDKNSF